MIPIGTTVETFDDQGIKNAMLLKHVAMAIFWPASKLGS
jgi:hypothetical protein